MQLQRLRATKLMVGAIYPVARRSGSIFPETTEGVKEEKEEAEQSETTDSADKGETMLRFRAPFLFVASAGRVPAEAQGVEIKC